MMMQATTGMSFAMPNTVTVPLQMPTTATDYQLPQVQAVHAVQAK